MQGLFRLRPLHWQLLLVLVEFVLLLASVYAAVLLRYLSFANSDAALGSAVHWRGLLVAAVLIVSMSALGLYQIHLRADWRGRLSRQGVAFLLADMEVAVWRFVFLAFVDADLFKRRVVMLGAGDRAAEVVRKMRRKTDQRGFKLLGYVAVGKDRISVPATLLLHPDGPLCEWASRLGVDEIVVGPDDRRGGSPVDALLECKQRGMTVTELTEFFEREAGRIKMNLTNPSWLVFSDGFNSSPMRRSIKRAFDVLVAALVLLLTWPLMLLTALAIRLESGAGAPILYRQERVGEYGRPFPVIKFRSMRTDAERDGVARWAAKDDDRVTRVGRFIRNVRLDELPQLWNVLRGDMSIIGPRPERPQFVDEFNTSIRYYRLRHCVKPGLTGWAQLRYPYGSSLQDAEQKLNFDLFYVKNHNLVFDLSILLQTVEVVLFGRGAR